MVPLKRVYDINFILMVSQSNTYSLLIRYAYSFPNPVNSFMPLISSIEKQLVSYYIFSYIANQFDAVDRKGIGNPKNVSERLEAIFTIWSRGANPRPIKAIELLLIM